MPSLEPPFLLTGAVYVPGPPDKLVRCTFDSNIAVHGVAGWSAKGVLGLDAPITGTRLFAPNVVELVIGFGVWTAPVSSISYNPAVGTMENVAGLKLEAFVDRPVPFP